MSIRRLLLIMIALLAALAIAVAARGVVDMRLRSEAIDWLQHSNRVSALAQTAGGALARERGLTLMLLSSDRLAPEHHDDLNRIRVATDRDLQALSALASATGQLAPDHALVSGLLEVRALHSELESYRAAVDAALRGTAIDLEMAPQRWVDLVTQHIEFLNHLVSTSIAPIGDNSPMMTALPLIKDALFTLSELLGKERAVIASALASDEPIGAVRERELDHFRSNILHTWTRTDRLLGYFSGHKEIEQAVDRFWTDLFVHYEDMRNAVVAASDDGRPYPVSAQQWFDNATRGIDGVLALSNALSAEVDRRAARLRSEANAEFMLTLVSLMLALGAFIVAAFVIQRRVLRPLLALEQSANAISAGRLDHATPPSGPDELGRLAGAFEHMRLSLIAAAQERETTMHEMRKLTTAIEQSVSSVIITDERGVIEYVNPQFSVTSGYRPDEVMGRHVSILKSGYTPPSHYQGLWETLKLGKAWKGDLLNRRKDGELYWESVSISPICDEEGRTIHFISIQHDISERKRIEARLDFMSSYDPLTRLPNRALLNLRFSEARSNARRDDTQVALLTVGIRHFKRINDSLGHDVGDHFLCEIATRLTHSTREHDTVSRLSGSEFSILLTRISGSDDVMKLTRDLLDALRKPLYVEDHVLQPILHAGIAMLPADGDTLDQLLTSSSMALHQAEREGSEPFMFFTEALNAEAQSRLALESALRLALATNRLELHYQPKVDLCSGRIIGAEALARWRHPDTMEYVPPDRFIPISEESGLIHALGEWALMEACRQNRSWQDDDLPKIPVAVNISALQLQQRSLPQQIADALEQTGLAPEHLAIELTESAVMDSPEEAAIALHLLKSIGVSIAIDDFGTGYSSLAYLNRFPVDLLKIDRSFISSLESDPSAATIASSVIALAHRMGLRVVAEGVENQAQLEFLEQQSCDEIQGYYFSPPLPADDFAELLRSRRTLRQTSDPGTALPQT